MTQVQRQVWQDLMRYDYCDSIRHYQFWYIDSLEFEIYNRLILEQKLNNFLANKDKQIGSLNHIHQLDSRRIDGLIDRDRRTRKQNFWLKVGISILVGGLILK